MVLHVTYGHRDLSEHTHTHTHIHTYTRTSVSGFIQSCGVQAQARSMLTHGCVQVCTCVSLCVCVCMGICVCYLQSCACVPCEQFQVSTRTQHHTAVSRPVHTPHCAAVTHAARHTRVVLGNTAHTHTHTHTHITCPQISACLAILFVWYDAACMCLRACICGCCVCVHVYVPVYVYPCIEGRYRHESTVR